jgi:drug/metabolite transporter (DMT)-like permease
MRWRIVMAYGVLYLVWGSTYLAMKIAVTSLPAFFTAASRFFFSGAVLCTIGLLTSKQRPSWRHLQAGALQGLLLMVLGNASVMWSMKTVPSGVGALIVATTPLFMALLTNDRRLTTWLGLVVGVVGIAVLVEPWGHSLVVPWQGALVLVLAAASWAAGSIVPRHLSVHPSNAFATGLPMVVGAMVQAGIGVAVGERFDQAMLTAEALGAVAYLAVFGSLLGFSCYGWLLRVEPATRVSTYAFVNPVVAVALGALVGGEPLSPRLLVAMALILAAVVVIMRPPRASNDRRP